MASPIKVSPELIGYCRPGDPFGVLGGSLEVLVALAAAILSTESLAILDTPEC